ncbi:MarR family winged helix-turn-helix transcriptional regulator [Amycolatopsis jejuensis]|uniref:MarR family winged helix-turn-helix transcriptional regulator n=1 Tax=Amycolatopsis jejuensis TaxID=330084 RepID=UPI0005254A2D|nr:MarR family winged helix-turn-helix transcriptional regulator [Amycolatopsis jejuensis]
MPEKRPGDPALEKFDLTRDALPYLLRRAYARAESFFMEIMSVDDLTPRQITLLAASRQCPGGTLSDLAEIGAVDLNTTSQVVKRLIEKGLLHRRRSDHDRRAYLIELTPEGDAIMQRILPGNERLTDKILAPLPPGDRAAFLRNLRLMAGLEPDQHPVDD